MPFFQDKLSRTLVALVIAMGTVIWWRESGPFWIPSLNYLAYICGTFGTGSCLSTAALTRDRTISLSSFSLANRRVRPVPVADGHAGSDGRIGDEPLRGHAALDLGGASVPSHVAHLGRAPRV